MRSVGLGIALCLLASGCGDDDGSAPAHRGPLASFAVPAEGALSWGDVPFPHDLYTDDAGRLDLGTMPVDSPVWQDARTALAERVGFCTICAAHFPIVGEIDRASLGETPSPGDPASVDDAIVMVDVDPESPERGRLIPLRTQFAPDESAPDDPKGFVSVRPVRGVVLAPERTYAIVLTNRLLDPFGAPLRATTQFAAARDGASDDAATARAATSMQDALREVGAVGVPLERIVSAAVFTTGDPTSHARAISDLVDTWADAASPVATFDRMWRADDGSLDDLLGTPASDLPGMDAPPAPGTEGERAVAHETTSLLLSGSFNSPRIVSGERFDVGTLRREPDGSLGVGPDEAVPFLLTIPEGADVANLPVVIVHWGIGGQRKNALVLADTLGRLGIAVMGIDPYQHGGRSESAEDRAHDVRGGDGLLGPDGLEEHDDIGLTLRMFGGVGAEPGLEASPRYPLAAMSQLTADLIAALHFVRSGDLGALSAADPALANLAFDPDHLMLVAESLGTIPATALLAARSDVSAAVLAVSPGSLIEIICEGPVFRGTAKILLGSLGLGGEFDEVDKSLCMDPVADFYRWSIEPIEPIAQASRLFSAPAVDGPRPDVMWLFGEMDESIGTPMPDAMVGATGAPGIGEFAFADVRAELAPLAGNLSTPSGNVTAGAIRYEQAGHGLLGSQNQQSTIVPPVLPPFETRADALSFLNPIDRTHAQVATFFEARLRDGQAVIAEP